VLIEGRGHNENAIEGVRRVRRLVGEVALHGRVRDEELIDVAAVVTGILIFGGHYSNNKIGKIANLDGLADGIVGREELLLGFGAEDDDAAALLLVFPTVKATFGNIDGADVSEGRR
jgi:hypothetical protein